MIDFLKLGGSLITDKDTPHTPRFETIHRLAREIRAAQLMNPGRKMIIGHGSGSFGHVPARRYRTREGVWTSEQWSGFVEVWKQARDLNQIVIEVFGQAGIQAIAFPPSTFIQSAGSQPDRVFSAPLASALQAGLTPVVGGDVVFDSVIGGTIFSTEDVFMALADLIPPDRVLLCGKDSGVWQDYPACTQIIPKITPESYTDFKTAIIGSASVDVTGGMREKVELMLDLIAKHPMAQVEIFSGENPDNLYQTILGTSTGTVISNS